MIKDKDAEVIKVQSFDGSSIGDLNTIIKSSDPDSPEKISQISLSIESEN